MCNFFFRQVEKKYYAICSGNADFDASDDRIKLTFYKVERNVTKIHSEEIGYVSMTDLTSAFVGNSIKTLYFCESAHIQYAH